MYAVSDNEINTNRNNTVQGIYNNITKTRKEEK